MVASGPSCTSSWLGFRRRASNDSHPPHARARVSQPWAALVGLWVLVALPHGTAEAQAWAAGRTRPSLFEIIAVDATGRLGWPFGREDVAGDGAGTYEQDEAAVDLRSVYAVVYGDELWLRAYVQSDVEPEAGVLAYFFIDADARTTTGGKTLDASRFPELTSDASAGGYEHALVVPGDGTSGAAFAWSSQRDAWSARTDAAIEVDAGVAIDPLRLAGDSHAFFQARVPLAGFDIDAGCDSNIWVRIASAPDGSDERRFVDQDVPVLCHAKLNAFGDPVILRSDVCSDDDSCPADGECREGTCVFGYECDSNADCRRGTRCQADVCVRVMDGVCDSSADCDGLLCESERCTACTDTGDRACADGYVCTPLGACIRPSDAEGRAGDALPPGEKVRGGAFSCRAAVGSGRVDRAGAALWLVLGACAAAYVRRRRRQRWVRAMGGEA